MRKQTLILNALVLSVLVGLSSCQIIGGIFKAGVFVGVFVVVAVVALIIFVISKMMS